MCLCFHLPCTFDGWVPILDFYIHGFFSFGIVAIVTAYDLQEMKVVLFMEMMTQTIFELVEEEGGGFK
jgi:hypothetical protein